MSQFKVTLHVDNHKVHALNDWGVNVLIRLLVPPLDLLGVFLNLFLNGIVLVIGDIGILAILKRHDVVVVIDKEEEQIRCLKYSRGDEVQLESDVLLWHNQVTVPIERENNRTEEVNRDEQ